MDAAGAGGTPRFEVWSTLANDNQHWVSRLLVQGHTGTVRNVALSANGECLASVSEDGTVRIWEAGTGVPLATLHGHTGAVWGVALSADGKQLASSGEDGTVRLWEAEFANRTRRGPMADRTQHAQPHTAVPLSEWMLLATLKGHTGGVLGVTLSADGSLVASVGFDGMVRLWEASTGAPLATLTGHTGGVRGVALSADRRLVASGGYDGTARLWETSTGSCLRTLRAERRYERLDITGLTGITEAQRQALLALGANERTVQSSPTTSR